MAGAYVDTSALGRVLLGEAGASAVVRALDDFDEHVASRLLAVELRRLAVRRDLLADAERLLGGIALVPVDETLLGAAEKVGPPTVATLDAIHLATALQLAEAGILDTIVTYDEQLARGARSNGLRALGP